MEYVQGVRRVGCNLQPMAAVRRVGAAPNIFAWSCAGGRVEIWGVDGCA